MLGLISKVSGLVLCVSFRAGNEGSRRFYNHTDKAIRSLLTMFRHVFITLVGAFSMFVKSLRTFVSSST